MLRKSALFPFKIDSKKYIFCYNGKRNGEKKL